MLALETVVKIRVYHFRDKVPIKAIARKRGARNNGARAADARALGAGSSPGKWDATITIFQLIQYYH